MGRVRGYHVDVALKQQRRRRPVSGQSGYQVGASGRSGEDLVLDAGGVQQ